MTDNHQGSGGYRDPGVWRSGLAAARAALHSTEGPTEPAEPVTVEVARNSEGPVARSRRIAAWVNGVGDPDQLEPRQ